MPSWPKFNRYETQTYGFVARGSPSILFLIFIIPLTFGVRRLFAFIFLSAFLGAMFDVGCGAGASHFGFDLGRATRFTGGLSSAPCAVSLGFDGRFGFGVILASVAGKGIRL